MSAHSKNRPTMEQASVSQAQVMTFGTAKKAVLFPWKSSLGKSRASQMGIVGKGRGESSEQE